MATRKKTYEEIFKVFQSPVTAYDCGKECSATCDTGPVCCSTGNAIPIAQKPEWQLLKSLTDLWRPFRAPDEASQAVVDDLADNCVAIECKGAQHCEREYRSLSCRAFPFFPYITREREFIGMSHYWSFEGSCWLIGNTDLVEQPFVDEFIEAYKILFRDDPEEFEVFHAYSATMRRVFSRRGEAIPLIALDGTHQRILPHGGATVSAEDYRKTGKRKAKTRKRA